MNIISRVRRRILLITLVEASLLVAGIISFSFLFLPITTAVFLLSLLLSPLVFVAYFFKKYWKFRKDVTIAELVEKNYPDFKNRLITLVSLESEEDYSRFLVEKLKRETDELLKNVSPSRVYRFDSFVLHLSVVSIILSLILFPLSPEKYTWSLMRLRGDVPEIVKSGVLKPPHIKVFSDTTFNIYLKPVNFHPDSVPLLLISGEDTTLTFPDTSSDTLCVYTFRGLLPGKYILTAKDFRVNPAYIKVVEKPFIDSVIVVARMPRYLGSEVYSTKNPGYLAYLTGTRLSLYVFSTLSDSIKYGEKVSTGGYGEFHLTVKDTQDIQFTLFKSGLKVVSPYRISVIPISDNPPDVEILFPQGYVDLPEDMKIPLIIRSYDDFGLMKTGVLIVFNNVKKDSTVKIYHGEYDDTLSLTLDLSGISMMPGDELSIYATATDLKNQSDTSEALVVRFPTLEELYRETAAAGDSGAMQIQSVKEHTDRLMEKIKQIETLVKSEKNVDWSKKESLKELIQEEKKFIEQVKRSFEKINRSLNEIQQKLSLDPEIAQKIQEIQKLFEESMTEELKRILENLNKLMQKRVTPEQLAQALEKLKVNQEMLRQNLERMENILRRFREEQKLKEFAERLRELESQELILKNRYSSGDTSAVKRQKEIEKEVENIRKEMEEFSKEVDDNLLKKSLRDILQKDFSKLRESLSGSVKNMDQGKKDEALSEIEESAKRMEDIASRLEETRKQLVGKRKRELIERIRKVRQELVFVSGLQMDVEKSVKQLKTSIKNSYFDVAQKQAATYNATETAFREMMDIFKNTMALNPRALGLTYGAMETMKKMKMSLETFRTPGENDITRTLAFINLAIMELYGAEKNLQKQGGSSTYFEEAMKKLSEAAKKQSGLNQQGRSLMSMPNPSMNQLLGMAARQAAIRRLVEEAMKLTKSYSTLSRMLGEIAKEMEDVEKSLKSGRYDSKIFKKQKKLLVKLLEAQRSIHKQEFTRKRESNPGKVYSTRSPEKLKQEVIRRRIKSLLFDIDRNRNIPEDYRVLIKAYLKSLLED